MSSTKTTQMLCSASPQVRQQGLQTWWFDEGQKKLERFILWGITRNKQDIEDLLSDIYIKLYLWLQNHKIKYAYAFAQKVARHHWIDSQRKRAEPMNNSHISIPSPIQQPDELLINAQARQLILHLKKEEERIVALLYYQTNCERHEIASLTGWSSTQIQNSLDRIRRQFRQLVNQANLYNQPSAWEKAIPATDSPSLFGLTLLNVSLQNLAPESERELLKTLEVKNRAEAVQEYVAMLRLIAIDTPTPQLILGFARRLNLQQGTFGQGNIYYQDYIPFFHRNGVRGQYVCELQPRPQYYASLTDTYNTQPWPILKWNIPTHGTMYKPLTPDFLKPLSPHSTERALSLYRLYPGEAPP